jgi:ABC-2 type transport system ATP-binding protein
VRDAAKSDPVIDARRAVVQSDGLTRRFGDLIAVDHLDLFVSRGAVFGLLGRNGAGKTTTIKMLITLLKPTAGSARVGGFDVRSQPELVRQVIGYVPQLLSADSSLTAWENLSVFAHIYRIPRPERRARIEDALSLMGLERVSHKLVRDFSGGMVRRLEVAQSMLHRPAVLFLDEPTIGLDPVARREVWEELRALIARRGTTLVLTTHDMEEADELCDEVAIMVHGRVVASGTPSELKASVGRAVSMDDVFIAYTGEAAEEEVRLRDVARTRRTARRLG